jgi:hypothetical protein
MSQDAVLAVVLCEDTQTECFIRRFLVKRDWDRRQIRTETLPAGKGSGLVWVREKFVNELKAYRSRSTRAATCLIVASDADDRAVDERIQTFKDACAEANVPFRKEGERVIFVIPRRNIETWLAYLRGQSVNEVDAYPKYDNEGDCRGQVTKLHDLCRRQKQGSNHSLDPAGWAWQVLARCRASCEWSFLGRSTTS